MEEMIHEDSANLYLFIPPFDDTRCVLFMADTSFLGKTYSSPGLDPFGLYWEPPEE